MGYDPGSHRSGTGKWYWEITITGTVATSTSLMLGIVNQAATVNSGDYPGSSSAGAGAGMDPTGMH